MARKLRLDCFLLCALQQNGGFFHACYTVGHMQDTLICLVQRFYPLLKLSHVSCPKPCSRSAEYYHLLISSFLFFLEEFFFLFFHCINFVEILHLFQLASTALSVSRALCSVKSGTRSKRSLTLLSAMLNTMRSSINESFNS